MDDAADTEAIVLVGVAWLAALQAAAALHRNRSGGCHARRSSRTFVPAIRKTGPRHERGEWAARYRVDESTVAASIEYWDLGLGEAQEIADCIGGLRWAVVNDRAARRCAAAHDVPVVGTLGIVLRAKNSRQIESARALVKDWRSRQVFER